MSFSSLVRQVLKDITRFDYRLRDYLKTEKKVTAALEQITEQRNIIEKIRSEANNGMPWLAEAIAQYYYLRDNELADYLEKRKNPALKLASEIRREFSITNKELRRKLKEAEARLMYLEWLFPSLNEIIHDDNTDTSTPVTPEQLEDEALIYVTEKEYTALKEADRNQLALDRYIEHCKKGKLSKQYVGKMYERYIGYLYEIKGYDVEFFGIKRGVEDLGRDLICRKGNYLTEIVQCKNWSKNKQIHENAICQLYGTTIKYRIDNHLSEVNLFSENVKAVFATTTSLSNTAQEFARALNVHCKEIPMSFDYPMIKCNVNHNQLIYHLPFDQQYDRTIICHKDECYVKTVKEAEALGFRRAKRWISQDN